MREIEELPWLILTNDIEWDPYALSFAQSEEVLRENWPTPEQECQMYAIQHEPCPVSMVLTTVAASLTLTLFPAIPKVSIGVQRPQCINMLLIRMFWQNDGGLELKLLLKQYR
jgi:hypothetical protein